MIYLDCNATTPLCEPAREAMLPYLDRHFGNPSSVHAAGREARAAIDNARDKLAGLLRAKPNEIIFTSGGTESCNLAVLGLATRLLGRGHKVKVASPDDMTPRFAAVGVDYEVIPWEPGRVRALIERESPTVAVVDFMMPSWKARKFRSNVVERFARRNCRPRSTCRRDPTRNAAGFDHDREQRDRRDSADA